jgi:hypothetical protein
MEKVLPWERRGDKHPISPIPFDAQPSQALLLHTPEIEFGKPTDRIAGLRHENEGDGAKVNEPPLTGWTGRSQQHNDRSAPSEINKQSVDWSLAEMIKKVGVSPRLTHSSMVLL